MITLIIIAVIIGYLMIVKITGTTPGLSKIEKTGKGEILKLDTFSGAIPDGYKVEVDKNGKHTYTRGYPPPPPNGYVVHYDADSLRHNTHLNTSKVQYKPGCITSIHGNKVQTIDCNSGTFDPKPGYVAVYVTNE
jgi:hypothetical protein